MRIYRLKCTNLQNNEEKEDCNDHNNNRIDVPSNPMHTIS